MKKKIPFWYIVLAAVLVGYGWISTFYLKYAPDGPSIHYMNLVNIGITFCWIVLNSFLCSKILFEGVKQYDWHYAFLPFYYLALNIANALNLQFEFIASFQTLFLISLGTKTLETIVLIVLIKQYHRQH